MPTDDHHPPLPAPDALPALPLALLRADSVQVHAAATHGQVMSLGTALLIVLAVLAVMQGLALNRLGNVIAAKDVEIAKLKAPQRPAMVCKPYVETVYADTAITEHCIKQSHRDLNF